MVLNSSELVSPVSEKVVNGSHASTKAPAPESNGVNGHLEAPIAELNVSWLDYIL